MFCTGCTALSCIYKRNRKKKREKRKKNEKKMLTFGRTSGILIPVPSDRDRLLKETQGFRKEIKKKFKKVLDKQNTA